MKIKINGVDSAKMASSNHPSTSRRAKFGNVTPTPSSQYKSKMKNIPNHPMIMKMKISRHHSTYLLLALAPME